MLIGVITHFNLGVVQFGVRSPFAAGKEQHHIKLPVRGRAGNLFVADDKAKIISRIGIPTGAKVLILKRNNHLSLGIHDAPGIGIRRNAIKRLSLCEWLFPHTHKAVPVLKLGPDEHAPANGMAADGLAKAFRGHILTLFYLPAKLIIGQGDPIRILLCRLI